MSNIELELFQLLIEALRANKVTAHFEMASIAVLVYDYILTFKLEVALVWGSPWNIGKVLFLLTRYMVFIDATLLGYFHIGSGSVVSVRTCAIVYQFSGWMIFLGVAVAEFILIFRTWAIWGQNSKVAIGLPLFLFAIGIPSGFLTRIGLNSVKYMETPFPHLQNCFLIQVNSHILFVDYVIILVFETVILGFTLIKGVHHFRHTQSSLVSTLYKDGILFYIYLTALSIANVGALAYFKQVHGASLILVQRVFHSMLTARILLHIRLAALRDRRDASMSDTPPALTTMFDTSHQGQLSTVVIGVDSWFGDRETSTSGSCDSDLV